MSKPKIKVVLGSIREGRVGGKVAKWFMDAVKNNEKAELELVDLKDYPMPLFADSNEVRKREGRHPNDIVEKWLGKVAEAQGIIFITPEYNHSFSSALKNAIDYGYKQWNGKSVGFVSYGGLAGGSRAVEHLRGVSVELMMRDAHDQVIIPMIWQAFDAEGKLANGEMLAKLANTVVDRVAELSTKNI